MPDGPSISQHSQATGDDQKLADLMADHGRGQREPAAEAPVTSPVMTRVESKILADDGLVAPGQAEGVGQALEVVGHKGDVGRLECDVGSRRAHGHPHAGRGQGRGVVDAVANHEHRTVLFGQLDDPLDFLLGGQLRVDLVDAGQGGDRCAVRRLSPVSMTTRSTPSARSSPIVVFTEGRIRSRSAMRPQTPRSSPTITTFLP